MRKISTSLLAAAMSLSTFAAAHARPDTRAYSCAQVVALVQQYESIVLSTGTYTYARYVSRRNYCGFSQTAVYAYAPTIDNPHCKIGYECKEILDD